MGDRIVLVNLAMHITDGENLSGGRRGMQTLAEHQRRERYCEEGVEFASAYH
jgi:hypothetical protein